MITNRLVACLIALLCIVIHARSDVVEDWQTCYREDSCKSTLSSGTLCCVGSQDLSEGKVCELTAIDEIGNLISEERVHTGFGAKQRRSLSTTQPSKNRIRVAGYTNRNWENVIRVFVSQVYANEKGTNNRALPDVEPVTVGQYDDTVLNAIDDLMWKAFGYKIKLNIVLYDRYMLCTWKCDAYAKKYNLLKKPDGNPSNVISFYRNSQVAADMDQRFAHIANHRNPYFEGRPWKQIPEAIFAFDMENEGQAYSDGQKPSTTSLPNKNYACDRATALRNPVGVHPRILLSTGGGAEVDDSTILEHFQCSALDIVPVHSYDPSRWQSGLSTAINRAKQYGKLTFVQEFGATTNKASSYRSQINTFTSFGVPWMVWQVIKPNNPSDFEVFTDDKAAWAVLSSAGNTAKSSAGTFAWPALYGADAFLSPSTVSPSPSPTITPSAVSPMPQSWRYVGCFVDSSSRILSEKSAILSKNGLSTCGAFCSGYRFAGMENGKECYCGNSLNNFSIGKNCATPCVSNKNEICGGGYRISVYFKDSPKPNARVPVGARYIGCFVDSVNRRLSLRVLEKDLNMTPEKCTAECRRRNLAFSGLEFAQECYCGNTISFVRNGIVASTECSKPCRGDRKASCGGSWRAQVYLVA
ncbi:WSC domain-containing protein [Cladochytrium replicatum]|nr:WSC domain-containing protein [Cladochytrium replicatum]